VCVCVCVWFVCMRVSGIDLRGLTCVLIMLYQVQRYRVLKQLSLAYAIKFVGKWMVDKFKDLEVCEVISCSLLSMLQSERLDGLCTISVLYTVIIIHESVVSYTNRVYFYR